MFLGKVAVPDRQLPLRNKRVKASFSQGELFASLPFDAGANKVRQSISGHTFIRYPGINKSLIAFDGVYRTFIQTWQLIE